MTYERPNWDPIGFNWGLQWWITVK